MRLEDAGEHHVALGRLRRVRSLGDELSIDADRLGHVVQLEPVHVRGTAQCLGADARCLGSLRLLDRVQCRAVLAQRGLRLPRVDELASAGEVLGPRTRARCKCRQKRYCEQAYFTHRVWSHRTHDCVGRFGSLVSAQMARFPVSGQSSGRTQRTCPPSRPVTADAVALHGPPSQPRRRRAARNAPRSAQRGRTALHLSTSVHRSPHQRESTSGTRGPPIPPRGSATLAQPRARRMPRPFSACSSKSRVMSWK